MSRDNTNAAATATSSQIPEYRTCALCHHVLPASAVTQTIILDGTEVWVCQHCSRTMGFPPVLTEVPPATAGFVAERLKRQQ